MTKCVTFLMLQSIRVAVLAVSTAMAQDSTGELGAEVAPQQSDVADIERRCLEYRLAATATCEVRILQRVERPGAQTATFEYIVAVKDGRHRFDIRAKMKEGPFGHWTKVIIEPDDDRYFLDGGSDVAVMIDRASVFEDVTQKFSAFHPGSVGMSVRGLSALALHGMEFHIGRAGRSKLSVTADSVDRVELQRIDYSDATSNECRVWLDPRKGYGIVRIEFDQAPENGGIQFRVDSELALWQETVWYPKRLESSITDASGIRIEKRTVEVTSATFGDVSDELFTMAGLDPGHGRPITNRLVNVATRYYWDDNRKMMVSRLNAGLKKRLPAGGTNWGLWLLGANAVLFAIIGGFATAGLIRRKKSNSS